MNRRNFWQHGLMVLALFSLTGCSYNSFTSQQEAIKGSWSEVENQLKRRNDLIPNLVSTVKGFAAQEKAILDRIAASREKLAGAKTPSETIDAANEQSSALARLLVVVENYPQLKSNENFMRLMDELSGTENRIAVARGRYNEKVQAYNALRRRFPSNITAKIFSFDEWKYFEVPAPEREVPKVDFSPK